MILMHRCRADDCVVSSCPHPFSSPCLQWGQRLSNVSLVLLGLSSLASDIALFWFIFIIFLQRGPVQPQEDEVTPLEVGGQVLGLAALLVAMLVYLPYPFNF